MTIKDVEKLTGLTAKSIRYYEDTGLLTVERNEENDYRTYSEKEVNRLKKIKLFRYLEFSVEEIKNLLDLDADETVEHLQERADHFLGESSHCEDKQKLCLCLMKDYKKKTDNLDELVSEYNDAIDFMESDEMAEFEEALIDITPPTLHNAILTTIIGLGPVLWLFINIYMERWDMLMTNAVLAVLGTVVITGIWIAYFTKNRKKEQIIKKNKNMKKEKTPEEKQAEEDTELIVKLWSILCLVLGVATILGLPFLAKLLFVPDDYLFYELQPIMYTIFSFAFDNSMFAIFIVPLLMIIKMKKKKDNTGNPMFRGLAPKAILFIAIGIWIVGSYCCITSVTIVTEDAIICHTPLQPKGIEYKYEDVGKITTGFGEKAASFVPAKRKGNFYYELEIDGKTIIFHQPYVNSDITRYVDDTYLELEEFDQKLISLGIEKEGNTNGSKNCLMESYYIERFCRIIQNQ